jgi:hypothetical protein
MAPYPYRPIDHGPVQKKNGRLSYWFYIALMLSHPIMDGFVTFAVEETGQILSTRVK